MYGNILIYRIVNRLSMFMLISNIDFSYLIYIIQLSPEGEVNSGGYIPRREASRYISTALHRP